MIVADTAPRRSGPWKWIILTLALLLNVILLGGLLWGPQSLVAYHAMQEREAELARRVAALDAENAGLSTEIRALQTDAAVIERAVRQRLNFVRENEVLYLFDAEQKLRGAAPHAGKN